MAASIEKLIINSPHAEPTQYWFYDRENRDFYIKEGRRPAGYGPDLAEDGLVQRVA